MSKLKIPFGLRGGQLLAATAVPNGLACECTCPGCGGRLVAKHPKEKVAHFAHHATETCSTGYETAIHLAAKQVLRLRREIFVPSIAAGRRLYDEGTGIKSEVIKEIPAKQITLDSVIEESREFDGIVPDIVATHKGKLVFIEIAVTHFVDDDKLKRLHQIGIPTLEIDLSDSPELPTLAEIESLVINNKSNRYWLINPRLQQLQQLVDTQAQQDLEERVVDAFKSKLLMKSEHTNYMRLTDKEKLRIEVAATGLSFRELSHLVGKNVRGHQSFGTTSAVWQTAIYRRFIHKSLTNSEELGGLLEVDEVCTWLSNHLTLSPPFPNAEKVAVWDYLASLEKDGVLKRFHGQVFHVIKDTAPNQPRKPTTDSSEEIPF